MSDSMQTNPAGSSCFGLLPAAVLPCLFFRLSSGLSVSLAMNPRLPQPALMSRCPRRHWSCNVPMTLGCHDSSTDAPPPHPPRGGLLAVPFHIITAIYIYLTALFTGGEIGERKESARGSVEIESHCKCFSGIWA